MSEFDLPTDPTIRRASLTPSAALPPAARVSMAVMVTAGRSVNVNRRWERAARPGRDGSSTAVSSSPGASAVSYRPVKKLAAGMRRIVSPCWQTNTASAASRKEAGSECGSAKHKFPPRVPTERTRTFATCEIIADISG